MKSPTNGKTTAFSLTPPQFYWNLFCDNDRESKSRGNLKEGENIEFVVTSYQYANGVINIIGSFDG